MAESVLIYHNPRCSKSCQALALLWAAGAEPTVIDYLAQPPDVATLNGLLRRLKLKPRQLLRSKETDYQELGLDDPALSDEQLIDAMARHPRLIERPIVVVGEKAVLGRPPEQVLTLLRK